MSRVCVGEIKIINRYPIKSFAGESLSKISVEPYGFYGDRTHAFIDETKQGWAKYITARQIPRMLRYKAEIMNEPSKDKFSVKVTSPDELTFNWDEKLLKQIQALVKNKISMVSLMPDSSDQMAVDTDSLLMITDSSLRKLESDWSLTLDPRRFRPNLIISLIEDIAFLENDWIGKRISIGNVELSVNSRCERCSIISFDPDTLEQDREMFKRLTAEHDGCFGVYASVAKAGDIKVGDSVYLVE